jgi:hypothetical protein
MGNICIMRLEVSREAQEPRGATSNRDLSSSMDGMK